MAAGPGTARAGCPQIMAALADRAADVHCADSQDLTTANPATTPPDNALAGLPAGAFTPATDRNVISPNPPNRTPITRAVPGVQVTGRFADDRDALEAEAGFADGAARNAPRGVGG